MEFTDMMETKLHPHACSMPPYPVCIVELCHRLGF